jgi:Flp pilus assembly CpaE family ATPase
LRSADGRQGELSNPALDERTSLQLAQTPAEGVGRISSEVLPGQGRSTARPLPIRTRARVYLGIRDLGFHQEVLSFLERDPRLDVIGSVTDPADLIRRLAHANPEVTVLCPVMGRELSHPAVARRARAVLLVAEEMTVPVLREAIEAGAHGVFAWPEERFELVEAVARARRSRSEMTASRGRVVAVYGARGGAGATFLVSHLAAAMAARGERTVVADLDAQFADLTVALGVPHEEEVRTIADLVEVADELAPDHLEDVLYAHPRGFSALLGPLEHGNVKQVPPGLYPGCLALLAGSFDVVLALVPRAIDPLAKAAIRMADEVLLVVTLDLFALFGARRALAALQMNDPPGRCRVVVNRAARSEVTVADVERILGIRPSAVLRFDPAVRRAQDRGELLPARARRVGRAVDALAKALLSARERDRQGTA